MAGWMNTPLVIRKEVDLGPGHHVLGGVLAPAKGAQQLAHVYCGHGRPSHLLLNFCSDTQADGQTDPRIDTETR